MRRTVFPLDENRACEANRLAYKSVADFERIGKPDIKPLIDEISGYTGSQVIVLKDSKEWNDNYTYSVLLERLMVAENKIGSYMRCIQKDIIQRNDVASRIYSLQQEVEDARKTVSERKKTLEEARERSAEVQNPYNNTTWWETWFPLGRPIRKDNVAVLLSVSILMLVFSLGIFLRFAGLELQFVSLGSTANSFITKVNSIKYP